MYEVIGSVADGSVIILPDKCCPFMKVCGYDGIGGVVNLRTGSYRRVVDLPSDKCVVVARSVEEFYVPQSQSDEDTDDADVAMRESLGYGWY